MTKIVKGNDYSGNFKSEGDMNFGDTYNIPFLDKVVEKRLLGRAGAISVVETFTGREEDLEELERLLSQKKNQVVLLVNGLGGIGKTTVAKKLVSDHLDDKSYDHICWIDYQGTLQESVIAQIYHTYDLHQYEPSVIYQKIISDLGNLKGNNLLVIDGFDNVKDEKSIKDLPSNFKTLITSRNVFYSDTVKRYSLDTLSKKEAKELFYQYCSKQRADEKQVEKLLEKVGYHTLTIEIMAKTLAKDGKVTVNDLLSLQSKIHVQTDHPEVAQAALVDFLTKLFDFTGVPENEIYILQNLAVLPSVDIPQEDIKDFLHIPQEGREDFINQTHELADRGWLIRTESKKGTPVFRCHQMVQKFLRRHAKYRPTVEVCGKVVETFAGRLNVEPVENPLDKAVWVSYGVEILESLEGEDEEVATLANNLALRYQALGDLSKALKYNQKALGICESVLASDHPSLANSYNNIAAIYFDMTEYGSAKVYIEKTVGIYERIFPGGHPNLDKARGWREDIDEKLQGR